MVVGASDSIAHPWRPTCVRRDQRKGCGGTDVDRPQRKRKRVLSWATYVPF